MAQSSCWSPHACLPWPPHAGGQSFSSMTFPETLCEQGGILWGCHCHRTKPWSLKHGIHCRGHIKGLRVTERARSHWLVAQMHHKGGESPPSPREEHTCVLKGRCGQSLSRKSTVMAGTARPAQVRARSGRGCPSEVALAQGRAARKPQSPNTSPGFPCWENEGEAWGSQPGSWEEAVFLPTPFDFSSSDQCGLRKQP